MNRVNLFAYIFLQKLFSILKFSNKYWHRKKYKKYSLSGGIQKLHHVTKIRAKIVASYKPPGTKASQIDRKLTSNANTIKIVIIK